MMLMPIVVGALETNSKGLKKKKKTGGNGVQGKNWDHPDHSTVKIS